MSSVTISLLPDFTASSRSGGLRNNWCQFNLRLEIELTPISEPTPISAPNATLVEDDIEAVIRGLKAQPVGEIEVAGPDLAGNLTNLGLRNANKMTNLERFSHVV
jgi:hypothetical protein